MLVISLKIGDMGDWRLHDCAFVEDETYNRIVSSFREFRIERGMLKDIFPPGILPERILWKVLSLKDVLHALFSNDTTHDLLRMMV